MLHKKCSTDKDFGAKPAEGAFDAFCPGRVVASWHKLATATPRASGFFSSYFSLSTVLNSLMDDLKGEAVGQPWRRVVTEKTLAKALRLSPRDHPASPAANILESNILSQYDELSVASRVQGAAVND